MTISETGSEKRPDQAAGVLPGGVDDVLMGREWGMKRKNHNNRQVELPNFCHLGVNLRIALTVEAALVAGVVARAADVQAFRAEFVALSALAQPALLLTLLALCAAGRRLRALPYRLGVALTLLLGVAVPLLAVSWLNPLLGGTQQIPLPGVAAFALLLGAGLLGYFNLRARALSPAITEARLQALQARIRPHFLFNSLNAVLSLVRSDPRRAERALENMADLFRALMAAMRASWRRCEDEVALTRAYLELEQLRLGDRLQVAWHIDKMPGGRAGSAAGDPAAGRKRGVPRHRAAPERRRNQPQHLPQRRQGAHRGAQSRSPPTSAITRATASRSTISASACCCISISTPSSSWSQWVPFTKCTSSFPIPVNAPNPPLRVLIVDDEAPARHRLRDVLVDCADQLPVEIVGEAENGLDALDQVQQRPVDAVLLDIRMPGMDGLECAIHLNRLSAPPAIIFSTAYDAYACQAFDLNAVDYLLKPVRADRLVRALSRAHRLNCGDARPPARRRTRRRAPTCRSTRRAASC